MTTEETPTHVVATDCTAEPAAGQDFTIALHAGMAQAPGAGGSTSLRVGCGSPGYPDGTLIFELGNDVQVRFEPNGTVTLPASLTAGAAAAEFWDLVRSKFLRDVDTATAVKAMFAALPQCHAEGCERLSVFWTDRCPPEGGTVYWCSKECADGTPNVYGAYDTSEWDEPHFIALRELFELVVERA
jgi:hypothetical protein